MSERVHHPHAGRPDSAPHLKSLAPRPPRESGAEVTAHPRCKRGSVTHTERINWRRAACTRCTAPRTQGQTVAEARNEDTDSLRSWSTILAVTPSKGDGLGSIAPMPIYRAQRETDMNRATIAKAMNAIKADRTMLPSDKRAWLKWWAHRLVTTPNT